VKRAYRKLMSQHHPDKMVASILEANKFTYAALAQPLEEISDRLSKAWSPVNHMNSVVSNDELREAGEYLPA